MNLLRWLVGRFRRCDIDTVSPMIRPPRIVYAGYDWTQTQKLIPTGAAALEAVVAARYQRHAEEHVDDCICRPT